MAYGHATRTRTVALPRTAQTEARRTGHHLNGSRRRGWGRRPVLLSQSYEASDLKYESPRAELSAGGPAPGHAAIARTTGSGRFTATKSLWGYR